MNKRLAAKVDMWRTVRDLRNDGAFNTAVNAVSALGTAFTTLAGIIVQMETLDVARAGAAGGGGAAKKTARNLLETTGLIVDGMLTAFASNTGDQVLLPLVNHEASDFHAMRDEDLRTHCPFLLTKMQPPFATALVACGATVTVTALLQTRYDTFHTLMTLPATKAEQESTYLQLMDTQETLADNLLDLVIDKLIRQFIETNPTIVISYDQARVINDAATQHNPPEPTPPTPPVPERAYLPASSHSGGRTNT